MDYVYLGRTGLKVSRLGLGCANFGGIGSDPSFAGMGETEEQACALMNHAVEMGINFLDTANVYGAGNSESIVGRWLKTQPASVRDQLLISTKASMPVGKGPNDRGLSRRHILGQVDVSLRRLGVERLDMFVIHGQDPNTPIEETLGVLDDLVHKGKIHYIGASNIEAWRLVRALWISDKYGLVRFDWVQNSYNLLDRIRNAEVLPLCEDQNLGFTPYGPLAGGWLTGKYRAGKAYPKGSRMSLRPEAYAELVQEKTFRGVAALTKEAEARGTDPATLATAWVLSHPRTTAVVLGPRTPDHLEGGRRALDVPLSGIERHVLARYFD